VLFVGNFRDQPTRRAARQVVREILPGVIQARPDAKFQFVGADPPSDLVGPNVECLGFVDDLAPYWRRANLVISPMPVAHGMATKIILALAFGKTVVATPQGAGAIPRKYPQLVVAPLDAFAATIVALLSRGRVPVAADDFGDLCKDFGWPSLMAQLHHTIEQTCGR
jgi:glycosyltransferase involved in cell wall biosynthesis